MVVMNIEYRAFLAHLGHDTIFFFFSDLPIIKI